MVELLKKSNESSEERKLNKLFKTCAINFTKTIATASRRNEEQFKKKLSMMNYGEFFWGRIRKFYRTNFE